MNNKTKNTPTIDPSRRSLLKYAVAGVLVAAAGQAFPSLSMLSAAETGPGGRKVLIVYFSRSGNTREIANQIHGLVGGDVVELQTVTPYPDEYNAVTKQAKEELNSGFKPALKTKIENIASYGVVFVGSPNWWGTIASPVRSFLSGYDLSGKTIAPFITHEGSGLGRSGEDIAALCPNAKTLDGLAVRGKSAKTAQDDVAAWLRKLGLNT